MYDEKKGIGGEKITITGKKVQWGSRLQIGTLNPSVWCSGKHPWNWKNYHPKR